MGSLNPDELLTLIKASPHVLEINGVLCRTPYRDPYLGPVEFWEPVQWEGTNPYDVINALQGVQPLRVLAADNWNNATYEYHDICLEDWPNIRPLKDGGNRAKFRRLTEYLGADGPASWHVERRYELDDLPSFQRNLNLLIALYNASLREHQVLHCAGVATFITYTQDNTMYSVSMDLEAAGTASEATWYLADYAARNGYRYLDVWNVSATQREMYKRLFFTHRTTRDCYYVGRNPYPWLKLKSNRPVVAPFPKTLVTSGHPIA